jgi:tRNA1(Val) A37 N6-methylase TrmN6
VEGLRENERIDDLMRDGLKIIQHPDIFCFSMDAILLSRFANTPRNGRIMDFCTGTGVIPILMSTRTKAKIWAVEIQPEIADLAKRSVSLNKLDEQIEVLNDDILNMLGQFQHGFFDYITCNPPYIPVHIGEHHAVKQIAIARHELLCNLEGVICTAGKLLKSGGRLAMVHRPTRTPEILNYFAEYKFEAKRIRFVYPTISAEANMVLIEGLKNGGKECRVLPPLIVYNEKGEYTEEMKAIYYKNQ